MCAEVWSDKRVNSLNEHYFAESIFPNKYASGKSSPVFRA